MGVKCAKEKCNSPWDKGVYTCRYSTGEPHRTL
nr:MAG TPA: hypothetical protein [Caudoviricetes sp.]